MITSPNSYSEKEVIFETGGTVSAGCAENVQGFGFEPQQPTLKKIFI
jgi:predicted membrane protein